jgi:hypothetical protein
MFSEPETSDYLLSDLDLIFQIPPTLVTEFKPDNTHHTSPVRIHRRTDLKHNNDSVLRAMEALREPRGPPVRIKNGFLVDELQSGWVAGSRQ